MLIKGSRQQMVEKAAFVLNEATLSFLREKQNVVIAVPGGRSVADIFMLFRKCALPWDRVNMFLLDERLVAPEHPDSNHKLVKEHMGSEVPPGMIRQFRYDPNNPIQSIVDYGEELARCGGRFDIVLASSGEDGHIGSLFPNHHLPEQNKSGFILIDDSPKPPPGRMSASYDLIRQADTGIILFFGSGKKKALGNFLNRQISYQDCPAKVMAELPRYYLLTDQEVESQ
jgi:6-phosphogluconolactonase